MDIKGSKAWDVLGGKTARACESCLVKRARWFCAADDAFLCQPCDASVHSANQLANKHDRVALGTSSTPAAAWFTRKPRTPRINPKNQTLPLVPEINNEDPNSPEEENGEQLLYRVPVFDPLPEGGDQDEGIANMLLDDDEACHGLNLAELLSTCGEELAADVEGLLGSSTGVQEDFAYLRSSYTDHISHYESNRIGESLDAKGVKVEEDDEVQEMIACHYASNSSMTGEETKGAASVKTTSDMDSRSSEYSQVNTRTVSLRLNYEAVMAGWASQGSPWTKGTRPQLDIDEFMAAVSGGGGGVGGASGCKDAGREARVSRYREKRRTRLFSNKIRYQVRKLNAENRPRIKGRFVKRPTISASNSLPYLPLLINKK